MTQSNTAGSQYMLSGASKVLKRIQEISDQTGNGNVSDITAAVDIVLTKSNKVFISDSSMVEQIFPPSGNGFGKDDLARRGEVDRKQEGPLGNNLTPFL